MKKPKEGFYDFMGNLIMYEGSDIAYDIDSANWLPSEVLLVSDYLCNLEEGAERYGY